MKQVTIDLYLFSELDKEARQKAISDHIVFMEQSRQEWEKDDEFTPEYAEENIEINEYLFFKDGELAHCTTYTGGHEKTGITEFHFHGRDYNITNPA